MSQKSRTSTLSSEQVVKDIRRSTRRQYSAEEKIRRGPTNCAAMHAAKTTPPALTFAYGMLSQAF